MKKDRLTKSSINKISARFNMKYEEFRVLPIEDELNEDGSIKIKGLKRISKEDKMSSTDRKALQYVIQQITWKKMMEENKKRREEEEKLNNGSEGE